MSRKDFHGLPCPYCQRQMNMRDFHLRPTWDHVIPRCRGGREKIVCCNKCNAIKGDMMPDKWAAYMLANPGWWLLTRAERRQRNRAASRKVGAPNIHGNSVVPRRKPPAAVIVPPELIWPKAVGLKAMTAEENELRMQAYIGRSRELGRRLIDNHGDCAL